MNDFEEVYPFSSSKFINIFIIFLFTMSIHNKLFCYENIEIDHILQAIQYDWAERVKAMCVHHSRAIFYVVTLHCTSYGS